MTKAIDYNALQTLITAQAIRETRCNRLQGGYGLSVRLGLAWHPVRSKREPVHVFPTLTAVGKFCDKIGIKSLSVEW